MHFSCRPWLRGIFGSSLQKKLRCKCARRLTKRNMSLLFWHLTNIRTSKKQNVFWLCSSGTTIIRTYSMNHFTLMFRTSVTLTDALNEIVRCIYMHRFNGRERNFVWNIEPLSQFSLPVLLSFLYTSKNASYAYFAMRSTINEHHSVRGIWVISICWRRDTYHVHESHNKLATITKRHIIYAEFAIFFQCMCDVYGMCHLCIAAHTYKLSSPFRRVWREKWISWIAILICASSHKA